VWGYIESIEGEWKGRILLVANKEREKEINGLEVKAATNTVEVVEVAHACVHLHWHKATSGEKKPKELALGTCFGGLALGNSLWELALELALGTRF
jgi:hypothetical protein